MSSILELNNDAIRSQFKWTDNREFKKVQVDAVSIDDFLGSEGLDSVNLLKVDCQGYDLFVLKGAEEALSSGRIRVVMCELNFADMYFGQGGAIEVVRHLNELNYRVYGLFEIVEHGSSISWCTGVFTKNDLGASRSVTSR